MGYACGECGPKHRIDAVLKAGDKKLDTSKVAGKDVLLIFRSRALEDRIDRQTEKCAICYDLYVDGDLQALPLKGYYTLKVDTCVAKLRFKGCCNN